MDALPPLRPGDDNHYLIIKSWLINLHCKKQRFKDYHRRKMVWKQILGKLEPHKKYHHRITTYPQPQGCAPSAVPRTRAPRAPRVSQTAPGASPCGRRCWSWRMTCECWSHLGGATHWGKIWSARLKWLGGWYLTIVNYQNLSKLVVFHLTNSYLTSKHM